jgi:hypothetical protein
MTGFLPGEWGEPVFAANRGTHNHSSTTTHPQSLVHNRPIDHAGIPARLRTADTNKSAHAALAARAETAAVRSLPMMTPQIASGQSTTSAAKQATDA